ncbi:MAG: phosphopantetheine-binding protein [Burkholderia sp.]
MNASDSKVHALAARPARPITPTRPEAARAEVFAALRAMLAAMLQVAPETIEAGLPIVESGLNSVELIDLIVRCQARYAIDLPAGSLARLTLASLTEAVLAGAAAMADAAGITDAAEPVPGARA